MPRRDEIHLELGPASLFLLPPEPPIWQDRLAEVPGPASLALDLLALAQARWRGVRWSSGRPAACQAQAWAALPVALLGPLLEALCPPWLEPAAAAELEALERYLRAKADFPGLDCAACQEQEESGELAADCAACPRPLPPHSARAALDILALWRRLPQMSGLVLEPALRGLGPARRRLLLLQFMLLERLEGERGAGGHCPLTTGHDTF